MLQRVLRTPRRLSPQIDARQNGEANRQLDAYVTRHPARWLVPTADRTNGSSNHDYIMRIFTVYKPEDRPAILVHYREEGREQKGRTPPTGG
jgi:hypothetical protein